MTSQLTLTISEEQRDRVRILTLVGELDISTAPQLRRALLETTQVDCVVIAEFSAVSLIDSSGIGALLRASYEFRNHGGDLLLAGLPPHMWRVLEVMELRDAFVMCEDVEQAMASGVRRRQIAQGLPGASEKVGVWVTVPATSAHLAFDSVCIDAHQTYPSSSHPTLWSGSEASGPPRGSSNGVGTS
jgi:anti-anti-sigma factor